MTKIQSIDFPLLEIYKRMYLIRCLEEKLIDEYHPAHEMRCPIHFCIGQETIPSCLGELIDFQDTLFTHYRSHGYYLAKGGNLDEMVSEFYGKDCGSNRGLAGSMELASPKINFHSGAIVGAPMPIAMGAAFANKYKKNTSVSFAVFGDGAMDAGVSYEVLNISALWELPLIMICENNYYAAHTGYGKRNSSPNLTIRAHSFGVKSFQIDGNDPRAVYFTLRDAISYSRTMRKPVFIEAFTYRTCGHVGPENEDWLEYRPADEIERWKINDPLITTRKLLALFGHPEEVVQNFESEFVEMVDNAIENARKASFPSPALLSAATNSTEYSPHVEPFSDKNVAEFKANQLEALLKPY